MKRRLRLFVYGTLQPQAGTAMAHWLAVRTLRAEPASAPGRLFGLKAGQGWYPALVPAKSGARVRGAMCELLLAPGDLTRLDRYEGREYRRICQRVQTGRRRSVPAQLYLWRATLPPKRAAIGDGDFIGWLRRTGRQAFATPRD